VSDFATSVGRDWSEASTGAHLLQIAADQAAQMVLARDAQGVDLALANAEAAIRKTRKNLRRALKSEGTS
jgi:hypothetical protein